MDRLSHSATTLPMELNLSQFCQKFQLDNEIQQLLAQHGFDTVQSVLEAVDGGNLDFKIGHIAEITWALNKLEVERTVNAEGSTNTAPGSSAPTLTGGRGGTGGNSPLNPGAGGVGQGPQISLHDVHGFSVISGGTGGTGGASGVPPGAGRAKETSLTAGSVPYAGSTLSGGWGGAGGYSPQIGGPGGHGEGPQIPGQNVAYFREITGGVGGAGGGSAKQGGRGGTGQGPRLTSPPLLCPIDDETRRRLPYTKLEDLEIEPNVCQLLMEFGFQTVGGLLETRETDLAPTHFKTGHIGGLKDVLDDFVTQYAQ